MPNQVEIAVRPNGREGYIVQYRIPGQSPVKLASYRPDLTTIPPTTTAECRAEAHAHKQGIIDGMRLSSNLIEGMVP